MIGWVDRGESSDRARLGRPVIDGIASATFLDTLHGFFVAGTSAHFIAIANVREHQIDPEQLWIGMEHITQRHMAFVVIGIHHGRDTNLPHVRSTFDGLGFLLGHRQCRQQHACQNGYDGDHHQKFNQGKTALLGTKCFHESWGGETGHHELLKGVCENHPRLP